MHSMYVYRPIPNVSPATKIRLRKHFTAIIYFTGKSILQKSKIVTSFYSKVTVTPKPFRAGCSSSMPTILLGLSFSTSLAVHSTRGKLLGGGGDG